jgi:hypothetical protein
MIIPKTIEELKELIKNGVEESQQLEYKAAQALSNRDVLKDIAKDVSAMANASGGVIIYGIKEHSSADKKHLPESITPIQRADFSKERLEQIINSNISPRIEGITIHPVPLEKENEVAYVVEIPQSQTAHQSLKDCIYYRRYNFEILAMQDYEIRDVMNRLKYPKIEMDFEIVKHRYSVTKRPEHRILGNEPADKTTLTLKIRPHNIGSQYAQFINYYIEIPINAVDDDIGYPKINEFTLQCSGDNTYRDIVDVQHIPFGSPNVKYGPSRFDPLLPGLIGRAKDISLKKDIMLPAHELKWSVYADNAPVNSGSIKMSDIKYTFKNDTVKDAE